MKKLFIAAMIFATVSMSAFANPVKVNHFVLKNFTTEFKDATDVSWTATSEFIKATFVADNQRMEAFYTPTGEKVGTSRGITLDELPVKAKRAFAQKYGSYNVKEAILFEATEENAYFIHAENDTEKLIVKVYDSGSVSVYKKSKK